MARTSEQGGVEYAIRRDEDNVWLSDPDGNGRDSVWEEHPDNATWRMTVDELIDLAVWNDLTDDSEEHLDHGYSIWERDWINEEDITDDSYQYPEPRPYTGDAR